MVMVNEENSVFAGVFGTVVDSQNLQIENIKSEINTLEDFIRQANSKIAEYRAEVTAIEAHRQRTLECEQSAESALIQVSQALKLIRSSVPNAEAIFRSEINKIFDGQPIAYLEASVEVVEVVENENGVLVDLNGEIVEEQDDIEGEEETEQKDTGINAEIDNVFEGTEEDKPETTAENDHQDTPKEDYDKTQAQLDLEVLKEAIKPENKLNRPLLIKAATIVKNKFGKGKDGQKHPKLNSGNTELSDYIRKYIVKFEA